MTKQSHITKTKSKTPTSKTGQTYQNSCLECKCVFTGYTQGQNLCSDECMKLRALNYEVACQQKKLDRKSIEKQILLANLEQAELRRKIFLMELENEVMGCKDKLEVVAYMDMIIPEYEAVDN